jgi:peptidyl-prolyl cis-trans isomerase B (cyclophilin B)
VKFHKIVKTKLGSIIFGLLLFVVTPSAFAEYEDTIVILETNSGRLLIEFFPDEAPTHVANFIKLAEDGFYTDTIFHRIISGFMVQGGDPSTKDIDVSMDNWGIGNPGYTINAEFNNIKHDRGIVSMARSSDPNSAGSQFFIVHEDSHFLDGQYTVFGRILTEESFQTLDKLAALETLESQAGVKGATQPLQATWAIITDVKILNRTEIDNLPEFSSPSTTNVKPIQTGGGKYTNTDFGISFNSPQGWLIQTPPKMDSTTPDIVVAGPKNGEISPTLTVSIEISNTKNLEQNVEDFKQSIAPLIEKEVIRIEQEQPLGVQGYDGYFILAQANFENSNNELMLLGFSTVILNENNKVYILQYMNTIENFSDQEYVFQDMLNSIELFSTLPDESKPETVTMEEWEENTSSEGGGCLIATAAFGSEMAPQVQFLREIRDNTVMSTQSGTTFMTGFNQFYYSFSPYVADYERENPVFKEAVKVTLTPLLTSLTLLNYVDVDSEEEMLGYGIGIILLNIGMYFVAPAAAIIAIKNRIK